MSLLVKRGPPSCLRVHSKNIERFHVKCIDGVWLAGGLCAGDTLETVKACVSKVCAPLSGRSTQRSVSYMSDCLLKGDACINPAPFLKSECLICVTSGTK